MAKQQLVAMDDLKTKFSHFQDMADTLAEVNKAIDDINTRNKDAAGNDQIGQSYHSQVDKPTKDLTHLVGQTADVLNGTAIAGQNTSTQLTNADQHAAHLASGA